MDAHYLMAHATEDETDGSYGGLSGNQTGFELHCRTWRDWPWTHVYRAVDPEVAEKIAFFMEKAVTNGFIGYDSNSNARDTLFKKLLTNGFKVDEVNDAVECDCSSLVYSALYPNTLRDFVLPDGDTSGAKTCPKCRHYPVYMMETCAGMFTEYTTDEYLTSTDNLQRGDILLNPSLHIAVWI